MRSLSWGVDGLGRAHICSADSGEVLFCMIDGSCGRVGVWILEGVQLWRVIK